MLQQNTRDEGEDYGCCNGIQGMRGEDHGCCNRIQGMRGKIMGAAMEFKE